MGTALLIIDVQQALCTGEYAAFEADRVIAAINQLSAQMHATNQPVVFIQHEEPSGLLQFGSAGWQLAATLTTGPNDFRVRKTTPDSFLNTELSALLDAHGIDRLVICGLQSDFCVDTTTRRALALGYNVVLITDAHSTVDNGVLSAAQIIAHHNATLTNISSFGKRAIGITAAQLQLDPATCPAN